MNNSTHISETSTTKEHQSRRENVYPTAYVSKAFRNYIPKGERSSYINLALKEKLIKDGVIKK